MAVAVVSDLFSKWVRLAKREIHLHAHTKPPHLLAAARLRLSSSVASARVVPWPGTIAAPASSRNAGSFPAPRPAAGPRPAGERLPPAAPAFRTGPVATGSATACEPGTPVLPAGSAHATPR